MVVGVSREVYMSSDTPHMCGDLNSRSDEPTATPLRKMRKQEKREKKKIFCEREGISFSQVMLSARTLMLFCIIPPWYLIFMMYDHYIFPLELIVGKGFLISPPALQMHIKSIIIRESKLDVLRQSQKCIIISLPKALQLDYLVHLCTLKSLFPNTLFAILSFKAWSVGKSVWELTRHISRNCRTAAIYKFWLIWHQQVGLTSIILLCTFED